MMMLGDVAVHHIKMRNPQKEDMFSGLHPIADTPVT
jgi:hypothetical protein